MTLLCLSDIHGESAGLQEILRDAPGVDVVVLAGDLTHLGGRAEAEAILSLFVASGLPLVAVGGNMDRDGARALLDEKGINIHGRGVVIDGVGFMGLGAGTPSPFGTPWELTDDESAGVLSAGLAAIAGAPRKVLVSHPPPRGTELDRGFAGSHFGSGAVREFLDAGSVDLCICGHIHEAGGREARIGGALCVNVGPYKNGRYALVTMTEQGASVTWRKR